MHLASHKTSSAFPSEERSSLEPKNPRQHKDTGDIRVEFCDQAENSGFAVWERLELLPCRSSMEPLTGRRAYVLQYIHTYARQVEDSKQ